jgi:hypothetical protein
VYLSRLTRDVDKLNEVLLDLRRLISVYVNQRDAIRAKLENAVTPAVWAPFREVCVAPPAVSSQQDFKIFGASRKVQKKSQPLVLESISPDTHFLVNPKEDGRFANQDPENPRKLPEALKFPKTGDVRRIKQKDGTSIVLEPRFYVCSSPELPYIGLKADNEELLPICYKSKQNQSDELVKYLTGVSVESSKNTKYLLKTGKQLNVNQYGGMLADVDRWMRLNEPQTTLYRYGIDNRNADSILLLLQRFTNARLQREDARGELRQFITPLCSSERSTEQLIEMLGDKTRWIDPRLYYHALRRMFQVELILFTKNVNQSQSPFYLTTPAFQIEYDEPRVERYERAVLVCINLGAEQDTMPVCEAVCPIASNLSEGRDKIDAVSPVIATNSTLYKACRAAIDEWYHKSERHHPFVNVQAQTLNTFGMTSWVHLAFRGQWVSIQLVKPIHSLDVRIVPEPDVFCSPDTARAFLDTLRQGEFEVRQRADVAYALRYQQSEYVLPVKVTSTVAQYEQFEKMSRILVEYACKNFATFAERRQLSSHLAPADLKSALTEFANSIEVAPVEISVVPRAFGDHAFVDLSNHALRVPSVELKQKLLYAVRQRYTTNASLLLSYKNMQDMPNYYRSVSDFRARPNTVVLPDVNALKLFRERPRALTAGSVVPQPSATDPYILYFPIRVGRHTIGRWLVQPCATYGRAIFVATEWLKRRVNPPAPGERNEAHTLLLWKNDTDYDMHASDLGEGAAVVSVFHTDKQYFQAFLPCE